MLSTRDTVLRFGAEISTVEELLYYARRFVALLGPRPEKLGPKTGELDVYDEIALALEAAELHDVMNPLPNRMAFAIALDVIQRKDIMGEVVDRANLPLIRTSQLRRLLRALNHVRRAAENYAILGATAEEARAIFRRDFHPGKYPALDSLNRCIEVLTRYLRMIPVTYDLPWRRKADMPSALAGVLTEILIEAWAQLPMLAAQLVLRSRAETSFGDSEARQMLDRVSRAVEEGLHNPPAPNDRVLDEHDLHRPAQFLQMNLMNPYFCDAAQRLPRQLQLALN